MDQTPASIYNDVATYLRHMLSLRPAQAELMRRQLADHLIQLLRTNATGMSHATATAMVDLMEDDECPFNAAQKLRVQDVVMGLIERAAAASAAGAATKQENKHWHNYLTAPLWACIQSDDTVRNKLRQCARHCVDILNMPNPDELTCRDIVATVLLASGSKDAASVAYKFVREFSDMMESMRQMGDTTNAPGLRIFPADTKQFVQMHLLAYPEGQPPVECKLDIRELKLKKDETPCRKSLRVLQDDDVSRPRLTAKQAPSG